VSRLIKHLQGNATSGSPGWPVWTPFYTNPEWLPVVWRWLAPLSIYTQNTISVFPFHYGYST